ncbi:MAG: radical SAM family heme chaperone HemW [Bacteroidia bacterium]
MAGIYIHIPFCKQACHYCDFHFSTVLRQKQDFLNALKTEILLRKDYLKQETVDTVYFGGGTPSLLTEQELDEVFSTLHDNFSIAPDAEITLEANPDDLLPSKLKVFKKASVNRLSIGIQSFRQEDLTWMNRAHTAIQAQDCVKLARDAGISNISIDLIYGLPAQDDETWRKNLHRAFELEVQHISAYALTVEPRTALASHIRKGISAAPDEEQFSAQFKVLREETRWNGFQQYEISNFGQAGYFSRHNTSYWQGIPYLGLGPSAHSFDGTSRQWNIANNPVYIRALEKGETFSEQEYLTPTQQYNEFVMTSLRTMWGCNSGVVGKKFGPSLQAHCLAEAEFYLHSGKLVQVGPSLLLTEEGMQIADRIASDLFFA